MKRRQAECARLYATSELIRSLMQLAGLTIDELAARSGVAPSTAHSFVSGKLVDTSPEQAEKYSEVLGVPASKLFIKMRSTLSFEEMAAPAEVTAA